MAVWNLLLACAGQVRTAGHGVVVGLDHTAVLAMGDAVGIERQALAALLPHAEAGLITAMNRRAKTRG